MHALAAIVTAFALPGFTPAATEPSGGRLLEGTFPGTARPGYIYLPPAFDPATRYPVVYLLHGMPGSPSEYPNGTQLGAFADAAIDAGIVRPFIAVMPAAGTSPHYDGEWAGPSESALVDHVLPWVDATLPTIATRAGRVIAGLSAGGYGAVDIGLRHPNLFGAIESWSGYFSPLRDGPFEHAGAATLAANDPTLLVRQEAARLRVAGVRFFVSTGPAHTHWIPDGASLRFVRELRAFGLRTTYRTYASRRGEWREQLDAGVEWAFGASGSAQGSGVECRTCR
jgi:enterochelin esterase-like enzyme